MALHIRDDETDALVRELAARKRVGLTDAVKLAVSRELERDEADRAERRRKLDELVAYVDTFPRTGEKADKAFFDQLSGD